MVRTKTISRITKCGLSVLLLTSFQGRALTYNLGQITQSEGEVTFLNFAPPHQKSEIKKNTTLISDGSYLTQDNSFFTAQLFEGSYIRVSPRSKISLEFDPAAKILTIHLFTGSLKSLFSSQLNQKKVEKLVVKSAGATFETVDGKFAVTRNPITDLSSVYVEKGTVLAIQSGLNEKRDVEIVHSGETTYVHDREPDIQAAREMTAKEKKFLHPSQYLKKSKQI